MSVLIRHYVFLFVERDCVMVCSFGLCFLIYKKGQCQSLLIWLMFSYLQKWIVSGFAHLAYGFLCIKRDFFQVCLLGIMFSYLQIGIVPGFAHLLLCFLIYKKELCQSVLIWYYVFSFIERDSVRVCSFGIMFSYLQKGIV